MRLRRRVGALVAATALLLADTSGSAEQAQSDFARLLEEAKTLFQRDDIGEASARLQAAIAVLDRQGSLRRKRADLAAGCLDLGFAYLRLGDQQNARAAFECTIGLDRRWRLDPQIYAPAAVAVFEEARASVEGRNRPRP